MLKKNVKLITIVIVLFLAVFILAIYFYEMKYSNYVKKYSEFISELNIIQDKVNDIRKSYVLWEDYNPNQSGNYNEYLKQLGLLNANSAGFNPYTEDFNNILEGLKEKNDIEDFDMKYDISLTNYYYFDQEMIDKIFDDKNSDLVLIVNFYTGNVISKEGMKDINTREYVHRLYDSSIGKKLEVDNIFVDTNVVLEVSINYGFKQNIVMSINDKESYIDKVYYMLDSNDTRIDCKNLENFIIDRDKNEVRFTINKSGKYDFICTDQNGVDYKKVTKDIKLVNPPVLVDGMVPISFDSNREIQIKNVLDGNWYDYSKETPKFAQAKLNDKYYVWIPRFEYKKDSDGNYFIQFLEDMGNVPLSMNVSKKYIIPFEFEKNGGVWISKFADESVEQNNLLVDIFTNYYNVIEPTKNLNMINFNSMNDNLDYSNTNSVYGIFNINLVHDILNY